MRSPIDAFIEWYDGQPAEIRRDIAFLVNAMLPHLRSEEDGIAAGVRNFRDTIVSLRLGTAGTAGLALSLGAVVDFVTKDRSSKADWDEIKAQNEEILEDSHDEGNAGLADMVERHIERLPLRSRQWIATSKAWKTLREGELSPDAIGAWQSAAFAASRK